MQSPTAQLRPLEEGANPSLLYEQTNDLSKHADFLHSSKQENNVSSPDLPAYWHQASFRKC
jgi:hypothetical protein